jgi:hypothetical protein
VPELLSGRFCADDIEPRLRTYEGRLGLYAYCVSRFLDPDVGENEQRAVAGALRGIRVAGEESVDHQELEHLRELAEQLRADREARAAMESGVQFAEQSEDLPPISSRERH